jgi:hypothetical protein
VYHSTLGGRELKKKRKITAARGEKRRRREYVKGSRGPFKKKKKTVLSDCIVLLRL